MKRIKTFLAQEVHSRFYSLPIAERTDAAGTLMRITAEVTRELMEHSPAAVDEFIETSRAQRRSMH